MRVSSSTTPRRTAQITEETRELILAAAEVEFAARGFATARLADIAERVGITRAAVIYHFHDKKALYEAVLKAAFSPLTEQIQSSVSLPGSNADQIERVIHAWFDYATRRPTLGRLFIREVASADESLPAEIEHLATPMYAAFLNAIEKGQRDGEFRPISAIHVANILSGAAIWLTSGAHLTGDQEPESPTERFATYRDELAGVARYLLGIQLQTADGEDAPA